VIPIVQGVYRVDRSYAWNYGHAPKLPRVRRLPAGAGGKLFDYTLNSALGVAAGPLLNSKWVEAYARIGYDILTYATVRSSAVPALPMPNIRPVDNREHAAIATTRRAGLRDGVTLAVSLGTPSMEPDVWRKDVRRAKDRIHRGQILVVSVLGSAPPDGDREALVADYAQCAQWAAEAGADVVEAHLAWPDPFAEQPQMIYENLPLAAHILHRIRVSVGVPVVARLGGFRTPRLLHDTATRLAPWTSGFVLVHGFPRRVVDEAGDPAFDGAGRERADVVGADTFPAASRQVAEMLSWRKAGCWDRAVLAVGGLTTVGRAHDVLREGADAVLGGTAPLYDPLFAVRFREHRASAVA
jgi:dihydroorotate dehydrogenase (NAD+) catalytic subunit